MIGELFRRFVWSILRVEWEQIHQGARLRVEHHLPIFIQSKDEKVKETKEQAGYGVIAEVVTMAALLIVIAVTAASM